MTLPTTSPLNGNDDDSDMFGPPRSSPVGYHQRSRVPMISPKLRQREERKRILQLCAHKLERIKDSEANLRRSVCINNTYSRLTDEVRREKQSRYLANLPKSDNKPETAHDNMYSPYNHNYTDQMELRNESYKINHHSPHHHSLQESFNNNSLHNMNNHHQKHKMSPIANSSLLSMPTTSSHNSPTMMSSSSSSSSMGGSCAGGGCDSGGTIHSPSSTSSSTSCIYSSPASHASSSSSAYSSSSQMSAATLTSSSLTSSSTTSSMSSLSTSPISSTTITPSSSSSSLSSSSVDNDLEILDRELNAINASMPLIDPEITQGAEQLEKAVSSRKRSRTEEENDRLVREALSQFYLPTQRVISAIDDYPLDIKRTKLSPHCGLGSLGSLGHSGTIGDLDLDLGLDMTSHHHHSHLHHHHLHHHHHQSQKEFEVIMDALRLSTSSPSAQDSCGQAAMMSESGVFHNLVVTSLET